MIYPSRSAEQLEFGAYRGLLAAGAERNGEGLVQRIYLDELPSISALDAEVGMLKLLIEPKVSAPQAAWDLVQREQEYLAIVQRILFYKFSEYSREEVIKMLGLAEGWREVLKGTKAYQEIMDEGKIEGKLEGELKGKLETVPVLRELGLSDAVIAEKLKLPLGDVQAVPKA